jgi:tight adherence protein C
MLIAIGLLVAVSATLLVAALMQASARAATVRQLESLAVAPGSLLEKMGRRRRQDGARQLAGVLEALGERFDRSGERRGEHRELLMHAGFIGRSALPVFWGLRLALTLTLPLAALLTLPLAGLKAPQVLVAALWLAGLGWVGPIFAVRSRARRRQRELLRALPDTLDLLVVCVEAGLGLNQALLRVAEEVHHVSGLMSAQLTLLNLEIRAGTPRDEALRRLGERTGVDDLRTLAAMLIQTERFGTSIATALRVQADTLRTKRRQRAEEAAAKTTIKLVFPLVLLVFPAMFVVILGPVMVSFIRTWPSQ